MYKNGNGINIDRLSVTEGDFKNGLEVSIKMKIYNEGDLTEAIKALCLFDKLHVEYTGRNYTIINRVKEFNNREVTEYKNFKTCNLYVDSYNRQYFSLGKVLYRDTEKILSSTFNTEGLIINLPIGEVDIIPNREALQFNDRTKKVINDKIVLVKNELQEIIDSALSKDFTLSDFYLNFVDTSYYKTDSNLNINYKDVSLENLQIKINGKVIPSNFRKFLENIRSLNISKENIYKNLNLSSYEVRRLCLKLFILGRVKLFEKADKTFKSLTKSYIVENIKDKAVILNLAGTFSLKLTIEQYCIKYTCHPYSDCIDFLIDNLNIQSIGNDDVPDYYVEHFKSDKKEKRASADSIKEMCYRLYTNYGYSNFSDLSGYLNKKGIIIYSYNTKEDGLLRNLSTITPDIPQVIALITVKKEEAIFIEGNKKFVKLEDFMKSKILKNLATAYVIYKNLANQGFNLGYYYDGVNIPLIQEYRSKYKDCLKVLNYTTSWFERLVKDFESKGYVNTSDIEYFKLTKDELKAYNYWKAAKEHCKEYTQRFVYKKMGRHPRIGLDLKQLPNLNK